MEMKPQKFPQSENPKIPRDQWKLPIGYDSNGIEISLQEFKEKFGRAEFADSFDIEEYAKDKMRNLVLNRLYEVENYGAFQLGSDIIDLERAKLEVENNSKLGKVIIEIEMETIKAMLRNIE